MEIRAGETVRVSLETAEGFDLDAAQITWEAAGGKVGSGREFSFNAEGHGRQ